MTEVESLPHPADLGATLAPNSCPEHFWTGRMSQKGVKIVKPQWS